MRDESYTIVVAPNHRWIDDWCWRKNDPPIDPRSKHLIRLVRSEDTQRLRGFKLEPQDEVCILGWPEKWQDGNEIRETLKLMGWLE